MTHSSLCFHLLNSFMLLAMSLAALADSSNCPPVPLPPQSAKRSSDTSSFASRSGPFDYRDPAVRELLRIAVEPYHFTAKVATLQGGQSTAHIDSDIQYTLNKSPNHSRALRSLADLAIRNNQSQFPHMDYSVPCIFIRASKFVPSDGMVNAIYAYYLARSNLKDLALMQIEQAIRKEPKNFKVVYEVGLAYYYMGDHKAAKEYSEKAKSLGSTAVGLDKLLSQAGTKEPGKPETTNSHQPPSTSPAPKH